MAKILLTITALLILAFIVVAMYCACVLAGRSDENEHNSDNNEGADDMFLKKQICPRCKTGKYTYDLDPKSETCPYICCWKRNKCSFYKPLDKYSKPSLFHKLIDANNYCLVPPLLREQVVYFYICQKGLK